MSSYPDLCDTCRLVRENTETAVELAQREEQEAAERLRARAAVRNALSKQVRFHIGLTASPEFLRNSDVMLHGCSGLHPGLAWAGYS